MTPTAMNWDYPYVSLVKEHTHTEVVESNDDGEL